MKLTTEYIKKLQVEKARNFRYIDKLDCDEAREIIRSIFIDEIKDAVKTIEIGNNFYFCDQLIRVLDGYYIIQGTKRSKVKDIFDKKIVPALKKAIKK